MSDYIDDQPGLGVLRPAGQRNPKRKRRAKRLSQAKLLALADQAARAAADAAKPAPAVPTTRKELARFVRRYFRLTVPDVRMCPHHDTPMDYLVASALEQRDLLIWANRGGGKTYLAALATVLDGLFRPGTSVRVLGGSFDQSDRLADYVREMLARHPRIVHGKMRRDRVKLVGGSEIRALPQSQRAVRGLHVNRIRCDEVDLFDADVWKAVQFSTRSEGERRGSIEVLSTLHRSSGLMQRLVEQASRGEQAGHADNPAGGYKLLRWCLWEVIERCPPERKCDSCVLAEDCIAARAHLGADEIPAGEGIARRGVGFFAIDDAIAIRARASKSAWSAEMLCKAISNDWAVFGEFDPAIHVEPVLTIPHWPTFRAIDFGYRDPFVCLWVQVSPGGEVHVLDEYVQTQLPISHHAEAILRRDPCSVLASYVDPAGRQRESTSGAACTELLAAAGIPCTSRGSAINEGIELIRSALAPAGADGDPAGQSAALKIHPRCRQLIDAFGNYHYPPPGAGQPDKPVKDGPDHLIDALRYFFVNRARPGARVGRGKY